MRISHFMSPQCRVTHSVTRIMRRREGVQCLVVTYLYLRQQFSPAWRDVSSSHQGSCSLWRTGHSKLLVRTFEEYRRKFLLLTRSCWCFLVLALGLLELIISSLVDITFAITHHM